MPDEKFLTLAALTKWISGETLSMADFTRIARALEQFPIVIEQQTPDMVNGAYAKLSNVLRQKYIDRS